MATSTPPVASPVTTRVTGRAALLLRAVLLGLTLTACGGAAQSSNARQATTPGPRTTSSSPKAPAARGPAVTGGAVLGALSAQNHAPRIGRSWRYSVTVTDASHRPVSGTVDIEFVFGGQVVGHDTPPIHPVKNGHWTDKLTFPAAAVGQPLMFQAVVHTRRGSITLDWPIRVRR